MMSTGMNKSNYIILSYNANIPLSESLRLHNDYFRELGIYWVWLVKVFHNKSKIFWQLRCTDEQLSFLILKHNATIVSSRETTNE